jgi:pimeloyl-ACP methyl ester carboxylesterase
VLHHVRRGSGEPLVLIHPLGAELVVWEPLLDLLAGERDVIAVDLPGFGRSAPLANGAAPTPRLLAPSVGDFLDQLGIERAAMRAAVFSGVEQIRVPVTLAWAELDRLVRRPRETAPGWRTLVLHDCGHIPTWDDPEQVARVLLRASV